MSTGARNLFYPEYNSPETNNGIAHTADSEQALKLYLSARYGDFFFQGGVNRREKQVPTGSYATTLNDDDNRTTDSRPFAELSYTSQVSPTLLLHGRVFYDGYIFHGTYIFGTRPEREPFKDTAISHWLGSELRAEWRPWADHVFTIGTEYTYHPEATQTDKSAVSGEYFVNDHRSFGTVGVYAQEEWSVFPTLTLTGGLRYDHYYDNIDEVSPRAGIVWQPLHKTHLKLLYGRAFRAPNLYELYYSSPDPVVQYLANSGLDEEQEPPTKPSSSRSSGMARTSNSARTTTTSTA